ncbi:MAG: SMC family ATPase [Clostridia bacterium]|nr:SMC family ATPase [Clostridia bacterium]
MKPVSLEFCGINSFSEPQKINFEELLQYGIFGIFGDTGSGKSTILDCIGFALYGDVTRSRSGKIADIINYDKDKAYVNFEFDIDYAGKRRRYRVERELKRKNAAQNLKVYEFDEEKNAYLCVADAVRQGKELLEKVIGLEQKDYEKCIALPQGEFAQFVKSARSDRLKLVSRLFDLERYGEKLVTRTNNAYKDAAAQVELTKAKLLPYEQFSEENNAGIKDEISHLTKCAESLKEKLGEIKEREKKASALFEKGKEAKAFFERYEKLKEELPKIELLEKELTQLTAAAAVGRAEKELQKAEQEEREAVTALENAKRLFTRAKEKEEVASSWDAEKAENEIAALNEQRLSCIEREKSVKRAAEIQEKLAASREEYRKLKDKFAGFDYEKEKKEIEERLSYNKADGFEKAALFREEYAVFKGELISIEDKFPETAELVQPLVKKYGALSEGDTADFSAWEKQNEEREKLQKSANAALFELEQRNGDYKAHLMKLKAVEEEGLRLKQELEEIKNDIKGEVTLAEVDKHIAALKNDVKTRAKELEEARKARSLAEAEYAVAAEREKTGKKLANESKARFYEALSAGGFASGEAANALIEKYGDEAGAKSRVQKFREEYSSVKAGYENLKDIPAVDDKEVEALKEALKATERESEECVTLLALKKDELVRAEEALQVKRAFEKELRENEKEKALCERLKKLLEGNKFMEFVAEEYLTSVALNASGRLLSLTNGQYFLRYDGGFFVGDNLHGGALRGVNTLSGGETFLVSLSLALSLSQEICARNLRSSEFFFLDEGFGTLDSKLVDTVMDSLEKLRGDRFSIGIISHVEELKHRINRKLTVKKATEKHGSQIISE